MNKSIVGRIENAIINHEEMFISMEFGMNTGSSVTIIPESIDDGDDSCIIYFDGGVYNFKIDDVIYDEQEDDYICVSDGCRITMSFQYGTTK